jgi:hypothetical protein
MATEETNPTANTITDTTNLTSGGPDNGSATYTDANGNTVIGTIPGETATTVPTTNAATDPFDAEYANPPLSTDQVSINTDGTVIPNYVAPYVAPVNITDLTDLETALFNGISTTELIPKEVQDKMYQGFSIILHCGVVTYPFRSIYIPYPNYLTFDQLNTLAQNLLAQVKANPSESMIVQESCGKNQTILSSIPFSNVTSITIIGTEFDELNPNTPAPNYT